MEIIFLKVLEGGRIKLKQTSSRDNYKFIFSGMYYEKMYVNLSGTFYVQVCLQANTQEVS